MQRTLVMFQTALTALKIPAYWKYLSNKTPESIRASAVDYIYNKKWRATCLLNVLFTIVQIEGGWVFYWHDSFHLSMWKMLKHTATEKHSPISLATAKISLLVTTEG